MQLLRRHIFKITTLVFLLTTPFVQSASPSPASASASASGNLTGVLRVGSQQTYPPIEFKNPDTGAMVGLSAELLSEIAKRLNVTIEWVQADYGALITGLMAGRFDIASGGLSDQPEREKVLDFVNYLRVGTGVLVRKEDVNKYRSLEDLSGKSVAFSLGATRISKLVNSVSRDLEAKGRERIKIVTLPSSSDGLMQLNLRRVDGYLNETAMLAYLIKNIPDRYAMIGHGKYILTPLISSWGFSKKKPHLRDAVHSALKKMHEDGSYLQILKKWNLAEGELESITINSHL